MAQGWRTQTFSFKNSDLMRIERTDLADMLPGKDMLDWEELEDGGNSGPLPRVTTAPDMHHVGPRGSKRFERLGVDACTKLMDATLSKVNPDIWTFVSLNPGPGHDLDAFLHKRTSSKQPGFDWGLVQSEVHSEFLQKHTLTLLTSKLLAGTLKPPGTPVQDKEVPNELNQEPLTPTALHILKWCEDP